MFNVRGVRLKLLRVGGRGRSVLLLLLMKMRKSRIAGYAGIFVFCFLEFGVLVVLIPSSIWISECRREMEGATEKVVLVAPAV
jgi:hypothetical protein